MLNVLLECQDSLYRQGMKYILDAVFKVVLNKDLIFSESVDSESVAKADIIVKYMSPGESGLCHQVFQHRKQKSLMIGLYDDDKNPYYAEPPLCFNNIVFINCCDPLSEIKKLIGRGWDDCQQENAHPDSRSCHNCQSCHYRQLSPQQIRIAACIYAGEDTAQIARKLNINIKTVSTHKRMLMAKFNLESNYELLKFLNLSKIQAILPNHSPDLVLGKH